MEEATISKAGVRTGDTQAPLGVDAIWTRWQDHRSQSDRDALVEAYTPIARMQAAKCYAHRLSHELEFADYLQFGMIGLIEAIERFDSSRGARFEVFGSYRIRGAILNGVESLSEVQKQLSVRRQVVRERNASLAAGVPVKEESALERLASIAIGLAIGFALEDSGIYASSEPVSGEGAYTKIELRQLRLQLTELVQQLNEQQHLVIHRHYFQQLPFDQIASSMQLTKGRISQIHKAALERLRWLRAENADFCASF